MFTEIMPESVAVWRYVEDVAEIVMKLLLAVLCGACLLLAILALRASA